MINNFKKRKINQQLLKYKKRMVISGAISTRELVKYSTKNKLKPDDVRLVDLPNTAGILPCIIIQLIIIAICHYTQGILS